MMKLNDIRNKRKGDLINEIVVGLKEHGIYNLLKCEKFIKKLEIFLDFVLQNEKIPDLIKDKVLADMEEEKINFLNIDFTTIKTLSNLLEYFSNNNKQFYYFKKFFLTSLLNDR